MTRPPPFRAEHIGSLLRPLELLRAREQHAAGELDREGLAAVENAAIARVVKLQEDVGLQVVTTASSGAAPIPMPSPAPAFPA
jgi:5-methyltetrahydropteroyltriglutamate--homocysteine methyltransferase